MNIKLRSLAIATGIGILVQIGLVLISESITFYINSSANQIDFNLKLIFNECCWPYFTPTLDVIIGTFYPFIEGRYDKVAKRDGIIGGAVTVLLSNFVGLMLLIVSRWFIVPQLTGFPVDFETRLERFGTTFETIGVDSGIITVILIVGYFVILKPLVKFALGGLGGLIGVGLVNRKTKNSLSSQRVKLTSNPTTRRIIFGIIGFLTIMVLCGCLLVVGLYKIDNWPASPPPCYTNCAGVDLTDRANLAEGFISNGLLRADLIEGDFSGANLSEMTLYRANLERANLTEANLMWSDLVKTNLTGAELSRANLVGANLFEADLSNANLAGTILRTARMQGVNLSGANLNGADLSEDKYYNKDGEIASYVKVDLRGGDLSGADLRGADLSGANLVDTDLQGAKYDDTTIWPEGFDPVENGAVFKN